MTTEPVRRRKKGRGKMFHLCGFPLSHFISSREKERTRDVRPRNKLGVVRWWRCSARNLSSLLFDDSGPRAAGGDSLFFASDPLFPLSLSALSPPDSSLALPLRSPPFFMFFPLEREGWKVNSHRCKQNRNKKRSKKEKKAKREKTTRGREEEKRKCGLSFENQPRPFPPSSLHQHHHLSFFSLPSLSFSTRRPPRPRREAPAAHQTRA